jgi:hypothetical protein
MARQWKIKIQDLKQKTAKSILYEILMESYYYFDKSDYQIDLSNLPKKKRMDLIIQVEI